MFDRAQLAALASVIDRGSFEAAAADLHITPSAVSQRIRALETQAGAVLVRRTRPTSPTEAGAALVRLARQITALEQDVDESIHHHDPRSSDLSVAVNADSVATWFMDALTTATRIGDMRVHIQIDDENRTAAMLRDGRVMAAVTTATKPVQGCRSIAIGALRYRAIAAAEHAGAHLDDLPRIDFDDSDRLPRHLAKRAGITQLGPARHFIPSTDGYLAAIRAGLGWGAVPELLAREEIAAGRVCDLLPSIHHDVPLHWHHWHLQTTTLNTMTQAVLSAADQHLIRPT